MSDTQCSFIPANRLRCAATAAFLVSVTVGDGHRSKVCSRHLAGACRGLKPLSEIVVVGFLEGSN